MTCCCICNGEVMEQRTDFFSNKGELMFKWWEKFSGRGWKIFHCYPCISSQKVQQAWCRKVLIIWVFCSLMGASSVFLYMNSQAVEKRKEMLANMCEERAKMLQDQFNMSMNHVQALAILVSTFHHGKNPSAVDQVTFAWYTERTAFERPLTSGVAYAVKVLHSEREEFEKQQGWTIKQMDSQEQSPVRKDDNAAETYEPSPVQEEYAPVIFAQDTISHVVSLDMLSGKEDRQNVLRARASGKGVLTAPLRLIKSKLLGVILTFAVYKYDLPSNATPKERIQATNGYLGGVFDIESLVEKLLQQLASKQTIIVDVYDTTNSSDPISMYGSNVSHNGIDHISPLNFGDPSRKHEMRCRFKQKPPWPWWEMLSSFGIVVIALLIGYIFYATMNRIAKVEDDYREMMELKKRAEAADVAKSQFLATVSHEIRTPMNGVLGMLQMLMDTDLDVTQQDYVRTAQASGKALVSLINEVLDQAKIESGKLELEAVQFNLRAVLDDVLSLFSGKSQDRGIEFTEKGHIFVTIHLIEEVMNSTEFETSVSLTDTLSGFPVTDKRSSWKNFKLFNQQGPLFQPPFSSASSDLINLIISVEDTGSGIPQEAQSRVFTPFMQVGPSISRIHGGTGIGLSISKCLVGLMNGEIGFVSEPHIGSTFTFTVVFTNGVAASHESKKHHHQQINVQYNSELSEFRGMTALVIDPRPVRAKVTKYHLQRLGILVKVASNINEAVSSITSGTHVINMILVEKEAWFKDSCLPSPLVENLWKDGRPDMPKIFLLANNIHSTKINTVKSHGCILMVIMKPLRASMLAASLQRTMGVRNKGNCCNDVLPLSSLCNLLHGKKILVVDDNMVNLRVAAGALKKYGAEVAHAESGKQAIAMLKPPHDFDACFMDIQMPEMDGFEATRQIRDMEHEVNNCIQHGQISFEDYKHVMSWHVPILAITADVIQATHEQCLRCGMDGYVSKPFEGEQLCREVAPFFKSAASKSQ